MNERIPNRIELKVRYLMPAFLLIGSVINFAVTTPPQLRLPAIEQVPLRSGITANYQVDSPSLVFPLVDPAIILDINKDAAATAADLPDPGVMSTGVAVPSATPTLGLAVPTLGITLPALISTDIPGIVNTVVGPVINTVVAPINTLAAPVNTVVAPVATAIAPIIDPVQTLIPLPCVPVPFIKTCP